jgi:tRNA-dihydrouridine synthase
MKNPWIYRQIADKLAGRQPFEPQLADRRDVILAHFRLLIEQEHEPTFLLHKLRTFTGWYTYGLPGGRHLRLKIGQLTTPDEFVGALGEFFAAAAHAA